MILPLQDAHKKAIFDCGNERLNYYLHKQAKQDIKRKLTACFVLADENNVIKGYYTLSSNSIPQDELPEKLKKKMPRAYEYLPVTLLGRLAVDKKFQGHGIGKILLIDAWKRSYEVSKTSIGSMAVIVEPIDERAAIFYGKYGFIFLEGTKKMFLLMKTIEKHFK